LTTTSSTSTPTTIPTNANTVCPDDAGKIYTDSSTGDNYEILCPGINVPVKRSTPRKRAATPTFATCIDTCSIVTGCKSVIFNPSDGDCFLYTCLELPKLGYWGAKLVSTATIPAVVLQTCPTVFSPGAVNTTNVAVYAVTNVNVDIQVTVVCSTGCCGRDIGLCTGNCNTISISSTSGVGATESVSENTEVGVSVSGHGGHEGSDISYGPKPESSVDTTTGDIHRGPISVSASASSSVTESGFGSGDTETTDSSGSVSLIGVSTGNHGTGTSSGSDVSTYKGPWSNSGVKLGSVKVNIVLGVLSLFAFLLWSLRENWFDYLFYHTV
jgi:hypothetical protein